MILKCPLTWWGARLGWIATAAATVEVSGLIGIDPLDVHLMRLCGFLQLRQDLAATSLRGTIHLKNLKQTKVKFCHQITFCHKDIYINTFINKEHTLNPSSCAHAYTAAVLPTPVGPVISTVLHSMSSPSSSHKLSSPPNQDSEQKHNPVSNVQVHTSNSPFF